MANPAQAATYNSQLVDLAHQFEEVGRRVETIESAQQSFTRDDLLSRADPMQPGMGLRRYLSATALR
jgi:hypothetical protein